MWCVRAEEGGSALLPVALLHLVQAELRECKVLPHWHTLHTETETELEVSATFPPSHQLAWRKTRYFQVCPCLLRVREREI